jgi:ketosteroid isomerase-like protein
MASQVSQLGGTSSAGIVLERRMCVADNRKLTLAKLREYSRHHKNSPPAAEPRPRVSFESVVGWCARRGIALETEDDMKISHTHFLYAAAIVAIMGCVAQAARADAVRPAIEAANADFSAAVAKGDGAAMAALYAADGQVMPAGSDPIRGTEAIQNFWQGALNTGIGAVGLKTLEVFGRGPTATEVGQYELRDKAGKVIDHGKYIVVWRNVAGKWKLLRDMFSTNVAPPSK